MFGVVNIAVRQLAQGNRKPVKARVLYFIGSCSVLFSQLSFRLARWVDPMSATGKSLPRKKSATHQIGVDVVQRAGYRSVYPQAVWVRWNVNQHLTHVV